MSKLKHRNRTFVQMFYRRRVFKDFHSLDVVFDAGGRVSLSLTAVTVTSQLLWPADFLQSPTLASKLCILFIVY